MSTRRQGYALLLTGLLMGAAALGSGQGRYMEKSAFLHAVFPAGDPGEAAIWLTEELREPIEAILGHRFSLLRVRYWYDGERTAWIFDEIGKEEPITIGIAIDGGVIEMVRVLEFRETRGWEVRYPFFTDQFNGARLHDGTKIDKQIDGITGATLSVNAVNRVVQLALFLHEKITVYKHS